MGSDFKIDTGGRLIDWRIGGHVSAETLSQNFNALLSRPDYSPEYDMLVIIRHDARLGDLDFDALRQFQAYMQTRRAEVDGDAEIKVAMVFERPEHMAIIQLHAMSYTPHSRAELRAFPGETEARTWLEG